jgi:plastocyanin
VRRWLAVAIVLTVVVAAAPAQATVADVSMDEYSFTPATFSTALGDSLIWQNNGAFNHTATSDAGFFNTGTITPGTQHAARFLAGGVFAYHCAIHPTLMRGKVRIPLRASTNATTVGSPIGLRAAVDTAPAGYTYDYQRRYGGGSWRTFRSRTSSMRIRFIPKKAGTWRFRSRVHRIGGASGWSPAATVQVASG